MNFSSILYKSVSALYVIASIVIAGENFSTPNYARSTADFLFYPVHAYSVGLSGAVAASQEWSAWTDANISLIDKCDSLNLGASYSLLTDNRRMITADLAGPLGDYLAIGISFVNFTIADIEGRDESGKRTGDFTDREGAITAGAAARLPYKISIGAGLRYLYQQLEFERANGIGFDAGAVCGYIDHLSIGVSARNAFSWLWWSTGRADFAPPTARVGLALDLLNKSITGEVDVFKTLNKPLGIQFGLQYTLLKILSLRGGVETSILFGEQSYRFPDWSLGAGINHDRLVFDYALVVPLQSLGQRHTFSIKFEIPSKIPRQEI